jgi:hypothetical protein
MSAFLEKQNKTGMDEKMKFQNPQAYTIITRKDR